MFIPNTPNVTAGFLVFVPRRDIMILDMNLEEAAKMIISAGLVVPSRSSLGHRDPNDPEEISEAAE